MENSLTSTLIASLLLLLVAFVLYQRQQRPIRRLEALRRGEECPSCGGSDLIRAQDGFQCSTCECLITDKAVEAAGEQVMMLRSESRRDMPGGRFFELFFKHWFGF